MANMHQQPETSLGKTFLIGMATPFVWVGYNIVQRQRPAWLIKEFVSAASRPLNTICFAFGLATGVSAITGPICLGMLVMMDDYSSSSKQSQSSAHLKSSKDMGILSAVSRLGGP
jgi:hypothetical protein